MTLSESEVVRLLRDASEVLAYLHGRVPPVIHRDLKPGNVIRRPDGSFAFVDFGAVRDKLRPEGGSTVVGTFGFMAPEQFQGRALPGSDVYAIAATAVAMLTGREPEALPHRGLALDVRAALAGRTSDRLTNVLEKMLVPDPDRRASQIAPLLAQLQPRGGPEVRDPLVDRSRRSDRAESFERKARDYERRALDYDARAALGGPEARGWSRGAEGWRRGAAKWREAARKYGEALERDISRRERNQARREARWYARHAARDARQGMRALGGRFVPWPFSFLLTIAFGVAIVVISIATQIVAPLVLLLLAIVFGRGMREAAESVRQAGKTAVHGLDASRRWFRGELPDDASAQDQSATAVRVDAKEPGPGAQRVRVEGGEESDAAVDEADHAWDEFGR